jgi:uncharacterized protein (DUF1778 family)
MKATEKARFDTRLSKEQKELFEYAASLGGFRTLTEFVIFSAQQQATNIVEKHRTILASNRDQEIFFDAIMNPHNPGITLKKAAKRLEKEIFKK